MCDVRSTAVFLIANLLHAFLVSFPDIIIIIFVTIIAIIIVHFKILSVEDEDLDEF